jgi:hypothetical protein
MIDVILDSIMWKFFFKLINLVVGLLEFSRLTPTQAKKKGGKSGLKLTDNEMSDPILN